MDFGFMQASSLDYNGQRNSVNRVVSSWDGFSLYLLVVDEASWYVWVFLTKLKEPPLDIINTFLIRFDTRVVVRFEWTRVENWHALLHSRTSSCKSTTMSLNPQELIVQRRMGQWRFRMGNWRSVREPYSLGPGCRRNIGRRHYSTWCIFTIDWYIP